MLPRGPRQATRSDTKKLNKIAQIRSTLQKYDILRTALKPESLKKLPDEVLEELYEMLPENEKEVLLMNTSKRTRTNASTGKPTFNKAYFEAACSGGLPEIASW